MRTPAFWLTGGPMAKLLAPIGLLYGAAGWVRQRITAPVRVPCPVICVGNLTAGGAGKTPVVLDLATRLPGVHLLTRGHGGALEGPVRVNPEHHAAEDVGDEALLLARIAPTWVARHRPAGATAAVQAGATAIIMDDGHQNPTLEKDLSIVVVDGATGFGNGRLIPAGPLRESIAGGLGRAEAVVIMGQASTRVVTGLRRRLDRLDSPPPLLAASLAPGPEIAALAGRLVVAFAGIGRPEKFFQTLRAAGCRIVSAYPFADHQPYRAADIQPILDEAFSIGAVPVTTAKDAVRLPPDQRQQVDVVTISLRWENAAAVDALIADFMA